MGRGGRARTQRKHFRQHRENIWKRPKPDPAAGDNNNDQASNGGDNPTWTPFATENSSFAEYYMEQGILSAEEWEKFVEVLRSPLPATFRINSSSQFCTDIQLQLENDFMKSLQTEVIEGGEADAIRPLPWYPGVLAWHSNFSRMQLRKNQTLERFHEFLKLENEIGNITRQEAVSMVPPLILDVHPEHFVLDMCAAPGSKTFQLLEIIHQTRESGSLPSGLVLANDLDVQRCNLLIHQTKRMCTANLIVTNHEAQHFPGCRLIRNHSVIKPDQGMNQLLFDRVLCDVPCSGDGTLRKAPDLWRKWNTGLGNGIHSLQVQIALRGMSLLRVGGRLVYSTCSMNPVENEAVVSEILRRCGNSVELVDVSNELPHLIRRPGLRKWKVRDKGVWLVSYKNVGKYRRSSILPSMFPSGRCNIDLIDSNNEMCVGDNNNNNDDKTSQDRLNDLENAATVADENDEEVSEFPLEHCMRILPHDQNTGAFFIAVFHKVSSLAATEEKQKTLQGNDVLLKDTLKQSIQNENASEVKTEADTDGKVAEAVLEGDAMDDECDRMDSQLNSSDGELNTEASKHCDTENKSKKTYGKRKLQIQGKWKGVDPVLFFKDEVIINSIKTFYGINESFPFNDHLVTRNSDAKSVKRIYYVSKSVKDVLELNFSIGQPLKIASIGLKMFERQSSREGSSAPCAFRISSEGLPLILPYITKQILCASPMDFKHLLQYKAIRFADFVDAEFGEKASNLMLGCCVIVLGKGDKTTSESFQVDESTIAIGCWKGRSSLTVMVTAIDCQELLQRLSVRMVANDPSNMEMRVSNVVMEAAEINNEDNVVEATRS